MMLHGFPSILFGEDIGKIIIPGFFLHASFGILETVDAHWTGSAWKIALAKRAEKCPDCHGEECSVCKDDGAVYFRVKDTIQNYCARPSPPRYVKHEKWHPPLPPDEPGLRERLCPKCQAKKCPTCKGKGETVAIIWVMQKNLRPRGRPVAIRPGNTNQAKIRLISRL